MVSVHIRAERQGVRAQFVNDAEQLLLHHAFFSNLLEKSFNDRLNGPSAVLVK